MSAAFRILSCILLRKMDNVAVSGFGAAIGLGRFGEIWALAKEAKTETDTMPTGTMTRAMDRNISNPPTSPSAVSCPDSGFSFQCIGCLNQRLPRPVVGQESRKRETRFPLPEQFQLGSDAYHYCTTHENSPSCRPSN